MNLTDDPGPIAFARSDLADAIGRTTTLPIITNMPERLEPPCVVITEGTPLLEPDERGTGSVIVNLTTTVIVAPTDNDLAIARLDQHVDEIVTGMWHHQPVTVSAYSTVAGADGQRYLAASLTTETRLTL